MDLNLNLTLNHWNAEKLCCKSKLFTDHQPSVLFSCLLSVWRSFVQLLTQILNNTPPPQWDSVYGRTNRRESVFIWALTGLFFFSSETNRKLCLAVKFTCRWRIWSQVRGRLMDEGTSREHAPLLHRAHARLSSHVHAAVGGAHTDLWPRTTKPAPKTKTKWTKQFVKLTQLTISSCFQGQDGTNSNRVKQTGEWECVCVPAFSFWGVVRCVGWSGLSRGVLPLFFCLHTLDLEFLKSNKRNLQF